MPLRLDDTVVMPPAAFKAWRERLELSQSAAAEILGISRSAVQNYELGHRKDDKDREVVIPKPVRLACAAIERGINDYNGVL